MLSYDGENLNWLKHIHKGKTLSGNRGYLEYTGAYTEME